MRLEVGCAALADASPAARAGLPADLAFCHPDILGVVAIDGDLVVLEVRADGPELRTVVERVVALSLRSYRFVRTMEPLWRHAALARYDEHGALERFLAQHVVTLGPGQYALVGAAAELRNFLDERFRAIAARVDAEPWHLPSIEQTHDLIGSTAYLASHAQHVTFGYRLPCHFDAIARFSADAKQRALAWPVSGEHALEPTGFILEPFVCHNVYRALRGAQIEHGRIITALGTCYRHEGFRFAPLLRQWEFSMREVVLVGSRAFVADVRQQLVEHTQELAAELDLDARLEMATDPFFVSEAASARTYQAVQSTKLELVLAVDDRTAIAGASFNSHGDHFTVPMSIRDRTAARSPPHVSAGGSNAGWRRSSRAMAGRCPGEPRTGSRGCRRRLRWWRRSTSSSSSRRSCGGG